ncbi:MAG: DUF305 domain-containing protein [Actinomycetes bacterium]
MIPHHGSALDMAQMARDRAADQRVKDLAARIEAAQDPEIETMSGWLADGAPPLRAAPPATAWEAWTTATATTRAWTTGAWGRWTSAPCPVCPGPSSTGCS